MEFNKDKKELNDNIYISKNSERFYDHSNNKKNIEIINDRHNNRGISSDEIEELKTPKNNRELKSRRFYNKFVNGIKKQKKKNEDTLVDGGSEKFIRIVNKMMDQILIKNNNMRNTIKSPINKIQRSYKRQFTFSKIYKKDEYLKSILLIQRLFKKYINKRILFEELLDENQKYLSLNEIKNKDKEELQIELINYITRNKELFKIINYYKTKCNYIELENEKLKNNKKEKINFKIEKQKDINIICIKKNKLKKHEEKDNKKILKNSKNYTQNKTSNKRVTIIDIKNKDNNENINENNNISDFTKAMSSDIIEKNHEKSQFNINNYHIIINNNENKIKKDNNDNNNNNNNDNKNENLIDNDNNKENAEKIEIEENPEEKKERIKKSRGLRKLLTKKVKEKKELLRVYFKKFYLGGLYMSIRQGVRKKTLEMKKLRTENKRVKSVEHKRGSKFLQNNLFNFSVREEEEENDNDYNNNIKRRNHLLTKIIYRKDRIHTLVLKSIFQKLNLRVKLLSLNAVKKEQSKNRTKGKKKYKRKSQSLEQKFVNISLDENDKK